MGNEYLGNAQQAILDVLWDSETGLTPKQIDEALKGERDLSTVYTHLYRLVAKGLVEQKQKGVYSPTISREAFVERLLSDIEDRFPHEFAALIRDYVAAHVPQAAA
jgi:predicted transcriptional regulator